MDKKIFEKKMRNKYRITAVSLLVVTLFFGTAMTSAIAGSVDKSQSSSTSVKGCLLCGSQGNKGNDGKSPSIPCELTMLQLAGTIAYNVMKVIPWEKIQTFAFNLKQWYQGSNLSKALDAAVDAVENAIRDFIDTYGPGIKQGIRDALNDPRAQQILKDLTIAFIAVALTWVVDGGPSRFLEKVNNTVTKFVTWVGKTLKTLTTIWNFLERLCIFVGLCPGPDQPQAPGSTGYTGSTSVPSASQSIAQSTMRIAASSTQSFKSLSVSSLRSSSVISQTIVAPSSVQQSSSASSSQGSFVISQTTAAPSAPSSVSSSQSSSVISQTIVAPTQQSSAAPVMISVTSTPSVQQATND